MLGRAANKVTEAGPQRNPLAKQLFPSSSPQADIRDQFKKPAAAGQGAASASARTPQSFQDAPNSRSNARTLSGAGGCGSLSALYSNSNNSFRQEPSVIDLTVQDAQAKAGEAVWMCEDDFSDDDKLDLEFEAPSALPILPAATTKSPAKENMPPPPTSTQTESNIPWPSSPPSHLLPPQRQRQPQRTLSEISSTTDKSSLKRESSGDQESFEVSVPKKAKKRVLPWSAQNGMPEAQDDDEPTTPSLKTPSHHKSKAFLDPSTSAVKEQKRQLKSQRQPAKPEPQASVEEAKDVLKSNAKFAPISLSEEQRHVLDIVVEKGQSVFFTGPAGTGKSVLMRAIINDLKKKYAKDPERVAVTASTGLAACNIGGITLHSFSGIGLGKEDAPTLVRKIRRNPKAKNRWLRTRVLIIDEVSMVDGDLFDKLSQIGRTIRNNGRPWGGIQLVITGDFFQLPPVPEKDAKRETKFAFDAATWNTSIDHTIGLTQVFRQRDPEFARMLNEMRLGKISEDTVRAFRALARPLSFDDGVGTAELFSTRAEVDGSNERRLRDLPGKIHRYDAMDSGDPAIRDKLLVNMMAPKSLDLKINAQVMLIKNLDESLVNGSLGKVIAFSDENTFEMSGGDGYASGEDAMAKARRKLKGFSKDPDGSSGGQKFPVVQFMATDGTQRVILCQPEDWKVELPNGDVQAKRTQLPLILAWALSIHKAQGQTLERVKVNLGKVFEKGQAYVALSRATTQQGLQVLGFDKRKVQAHPRVVAFYNKLYSAEHAIGRKPAAITDFMNNQKNTTTAPPARKVSEVVDLDDDEEVMVSSYY